MSTGPGAFLGNEGASGLWQCEPAYLKKRPHLVGRPTNSAKSSWWDTLQPAAVSSTDLVGGVTFLDWHTSNFSGASPRFSPSSERLGLPPEAPFLGEHRRHLFLGEYRMCLSYSSAPRPTFKKPSATLVRVVGCVTNAVDLTRWVNLMKHTWQPWHTRPDQLHGSGRVCHVSGLT